jgi:phosphoribosyl 1,2-cyclic phosphate phosphodiesterase
MKIKILGCGPSGGVPFIGNIWGSCDSSNILNSRTRSSIIISENNMNILVDTSPDLRHQLLRENISDIDFVIITHDHADHTHGIDDLRSIVFQKRKEILGFRMNVYSREHTKNSLISRFSHSFEGLSYLKAEDLEESTNVFGINIKSFDQNHGKDFLSTGIRINNFAYTTDVKSFVSDEYLYGLDAWLVGCISISESPSHANIELILEWFNRYKPKKMYITHMGVEIDYSKIQDLLPRDVIPCYDGMDIEVKE